MQARLKVLHDKANVKQVKLLPVTLIGRSTDCNLKIASSQVSRNHCRITLGVDAVFVEDLGSANGTMVDGQPIPAHQPTAIAPGAHLIVGPAEFQIDYVASTSPTMVLPRTGVPPIQEMPSTEMIFPSSARGSDAAVVAAPVAAVSAPAVATPAATPAVITTPLPDGRGSGGIVTTPAASTPVAAIPSASPVAPSAPAAVVMPPAAPQAVPDFSAPVPVAASTPPFGMTTPENGVPAMAGETVAEFPAIAPPTNRGSDTEFLPPGFDFNAEPVDEEADQATQFMFAETSPESASFGDGSSGAAATAPTPAESAPKKGGLKSLFSLFGRKDKPASSAQSSSAAKSPAAKTPVAEPAVFLPTMDAQAVAEPIEEPAQELSFSNQVAESTELAETTGAAETAEFTGEQAGDTSTEEDDGFQQFLSQL